MSGFLDVLKERVNIGKNLRNSVKKNKIDEDYHKKYDEVLNLDAQNLTATLALPVGFRADDDYMKDLKKVRKNLEDVIIEIN